MKKCPNCGGEVTHWLDHLRKLLTSDPFYSCSPKAERSEVLQGCPPSANCSAGAGADAQPNSLISSPVPRDKRSDDFLEALEEALRKINQAEGYFLIGKIVSGKYMLSDGKFKLEQALDKYERGASKKLAALTPQGERALARNAALSEAADR